MLGQAIELLGYKWTQEKEQIHLPLPLLGLVFSVGEDQVACSNSEERKRHLVRELLTLRAATPEEYNLSSIIGKLVFAGKGFCGRAGVHAR